MQALGFWVMVMTGISLINGRPPIECLSRRTFWRNCCCRDHRLSRGSMENFAEELSDPYGFWCPAPQR